MEEIREEEEFNNNNNKNFNKNKIIKINFNKTNLNEIFIRNRILTSENKINRNINTPSTINDTNESKKITINNVNNIFVNKKIYTPRNSIFNNNKKEIVGNNIIIPVLPLRPFSNVNKKNLKLNKFRKIKIEKGIFNQNLFNSLKNNFKNVERNFHNYFSVYNSKNNSKKDILKLNKL